MNRAMFQEGSYCSNNLSCHTALSIIGMKFLDCSEMKPLLEQRQNKGDKEGLLAWQVWGVQKADPDLEQTFASHKGTVQT